MQNDQEADQTDHGATSAGDRRSSPLATEPDVVAVGAEPDAAAVGTKLDVVAIGNALVDVLASATDNDLDRLGLVKGTMALVDSERSTAIYDSSGTDRRGVGRISRQHGRRRGSAGRPGCVSRPGG